MAVQVFIGTGNYSENPSKKSAEAYKTVWTDRGSPLIVISEQIQKKLQQVVDVPVALGMRYAQPY